MREPRELGAVGRYALLSATVFGTMANNVINVPLHTIARDLGSSLSSAVLAVSAFIIMLSVAMPITGWFGDRFGRRRVLLLALLLMSAGQVAAAAAPNLPVLIGARAVQGLACSAIPPMVMGMLVTFCPGRRVQMMGAWAAANGVGQALGPPIGGVLADAIGWRPLFLVMGLGTTGALAVIAGTVPPLRGVRQSFDLVGASLLSTGMLLVLVATTAVSLPEMGRVLPVSLGAVGAALLVAFVVVSAGNPRALLPLHLLVETRFLRSTTATFTQMFMLGVVLVAVPLHLTADLGLSTWHTGLLFFQLPFVMFLLAPVVGHLAARSGGRRILRLGMVLTLVGGLLSAWLLGVPGAPAGEVTVSALLVLLGAGMACVQTPAAAGATRSPAGARGAALGVYNMLRFAGAAAGTAWVAIAFSTLGIVWMFVVASVVVAGGLVATFLGADPRDPVEVEAASAAVGT